MKKLIIILSISVLISCDFNDYTSNNSANTSNNITNDVIETNYTKNFDENNPAFRSYLSKIIGNYQIIEKNSDYVLLKTEDLWRGEEYYYYSESNYIITDVKPYIMLGVIQWGKHGDALHTSTEDNLTIEPILLNIRDKYDLSPHMFYFRTSKGSDYTDIFNHILKVDYNVSIQTYLTDILNKEYKARNSYEEKNKLEEKSKQTESDEFIEQLNKH